MSTPTSGRARLDALPAVIATDLLGLEVRTSAGSLLGRIDDIVVPLAELDGAHAVVAFRRRADVEATSGAVPLSAFVADHDEGVLLLDVSSDQITSTSSSVERDWVVVGHRSNRNSALDHHLRS